MIRLHALHRRSAGRNALVVLRDTRWEDSRQIIRTIEVNLLWKNKLVYIVPRYGFYGGIDDFHNHVEVVVQTHEYDTWQGGESNLLVIMAMIEEVRKKLKGMSWNLKPSEQTTVRVPLRVAVNERLNRSLSLQKEKATASTEEEKDFHSNKVRLLKELLKEKTEQVQQMIKDQAKEYYENRAIMQRKEELWQSEKKAHHRTSLANLKATTEYQEAIQATKEIESPAVGFAKTSDYKGGLTNQVNVVIKQNNTLLYLASKQSQKLIELKEKFDRLKQKVYTIIEKEIQPADLEDSISSLAKRLDNFSISGKILVKRTDGKIHTTKLPTPEDQICGYQAMTKAAKEAVKAMRRYYKQSYNAKPKSASACQLKTTTGLTKEKTSEFKTKRPE
ncbi:hypothetical protein Tco_0058148 [Tanacetum coccineum]